MKTIAFNYDAGVLADDYIENFSDLLDNPIITGSSSHQNSEVN
jgi:hypothetical protein